MKLTQPLIEKIIKTLPISYYLGRGYSVEVSDLTKQSYTNLIEKKIVISLAQILQYDFDYETIEEAEKDIRCLFYHELSHALLTPLSKKIIIDKAIFNIFEDERIETLLESFYIDVDFKKFLNKVYPNSTLDLFFKVVRLRQGTDELNSKVNQLIVKYSNLKYTPSPISTLAYQRDIKELYEAIVADGDKCLSKAEELVITPGAIIAETVKPTNEISEDLKLTVLFEAYSQLYQYTSPSFKEKLEEIVKRRRLFNMKKLGGHAARTGKIQAKLIVKPENNYKWFKRGGEGTLNNGSGFKLNLFIDKSGSAKANEEILNSIIHELVIVERSIKNFSLDLVTIDTLTKLRSKDDYFVECSGGNCLTSEISKIFHKVQTPNCQIINIVLFHGNCITDDANDNGQILKAGSLSQAKNLTVFNRPNTLIISDYANKEYLGEFCKKAKVILTRNYLEELENSILKFMAQKLK